MHFTNIYKQNINEKLQIYIEYAIKLHILNFILDCS